jgi:hypothetical protein
MTRVERIIADPQITSVSLSLANQSRSIGACAETFDDLNVLLQGP